MKLIDILVRELPKRGGWPFNITAAVQDSSGYVYQAGGGNHMFHSELADDWMMAQIPREQYEAALASSKPEWDGEGVPPVGAEVEAFNSVTDRWYPVRIVYSSGRNSAWIELDSNGNIDSSSSSLMRFRPIRSEADKKRDEAAKGLIEYLDKETDIDNVFSIQDVLGFYDAIAAGKIPHIRID